MGTIELIFPPRCQVGGEMSHLSQFASVNIDCDGFISASWSVAPAPPLSLQGRCFDALMLVVDVEGRDIKTDVLLFPNKPHKPVCSVGSGRNLWTPQEVLH